MEHAIKEPARQTLVAGSYDVIVCGGGPAGVSAAICAARAGARVHLIDVNGCLGGVWTAGQLSWLFEMDHPGIAREISQKLNEMGAARKGGDPSCANAPLPSRYAYDVESMKLLLEKLCLEHGINVLLKSRVVGVHVNEGLICGVITENCGGRQAWLGNVIIDASGNGDVAALAKCKYDIGRPETGACQPLTMKALLRCKSVESLKPWISFYEGNLDKSDRKQSVNALLKSLTDVGVTPSYAKPTLFHVNDGILAFVINHEYDVSALDGQEMSDATVRARAEIFNAVEKLKTLGGPFEGLCVVSSAEQIGIREGRRIKGRYMLSRDDVLSGARFEDAIARCRFNIDIHSTNKERGTGIESHPAIQPYDIPLRCLLPEALDGMLLAGRCISGDFYAHGSYRVTGTASRLGQVAGCCAALAVQQGVRPHEVSFSSLQRELPPLE